MRYAHPGSEGAVVSFKSRYGNFINGEFVEPVNGQYFTNLSPVNGQPRHYRNLGQRQGRARNP